MARCLEKPINISLNFVPHVIIPDTCSTQHGSLMVTSIHRIQKSTKHNQKLEKC